MEEYITKKSEELYTEGKNYLVNGVASSAHRYKKEEYPILIKSGKGSKVYDVDGNEYIDYVSGYGPMILGYCNPISDKYVKEQLDRGGQFATTTEEMLNLAKRLCEVIPCAERVSFQSTGTEADMHAFRLARAYTGKYKIVKFEGQYHGWTDEIKVTAYVDSTEDLGDRYAPNRIPGNKGQRLAASDDILLAPWNDIEVLEAMFEKHADEIAAVVTEPIMTNNGPIFPKEGYLQALRELTKKYNILLIFDEVVTGFRIRLGGAQEYFNVMPDLAVFAKAVTAGYPLSVVAGKAEIMECGVASAGTFNGNPVCVAAALGAIEALSQPDVYKKLDKVNAYFVNGIQELGKKYNVTLYTEGVGGLVSIQFGMDRPLVDYRDCLDHVDYEKYDQLYFGCLKYGVRLMPEKGRTYITTAHTKEDIDKTLQVFEEVFQTF